MTYLSYIHSSGILIVRKYQGAHDMQEVRRSMRRLIGTFEAPDIERARRIANELKGAGV